MNDVQIILPERSADAVSEDLRYLTELILTHKLGDDQSMGFGLGGAFGYGADFENETFMLHRFCWCEQDDCDWCANAAPNFLHKRTGSVIHWYKWIGRSMDLDLKTDWTAIFHDCMDSIGVGL